MKNGAVIFFTEELPGTGQPMEAGGMEKGAGKESCAGKDYPFFP